MARISRRQIENEIELQISKDPLVRRRPKEFAEEVRDHAKREWHLAGPHPYGTGRFDETIHVERARGLRGRFLGGLSAYKVVSDDDNANMIENGTGPDKPGSKSPYGPNTPTPEFAIFAKTAHHYGGTAP